MELAIVGKQAFSVPKHVLWHHLNDPASLKRSIPGCVAMREIAPDQYEIELQLQVASVGGSFTGHISLADKRAPETCRITVQGEGSLGHGTGSAQFELLEEAIDRTTIVYNGSGEIGGLVAGVGQRVLSGVSKFLIKRFFTALSKHLNEPGSTSAVSDTSV